jgi:hypothetical protein
MVWNPQTTTNAWSPKSSSTQNSTISSSALTAVQWAQKKAENSNSGAKNGITSSVPHPTPNTNGDADYLGEEGHQYIEIGYFFAHLMLHAQALKLLDDGKGTPIEGSPAPVRTPGGEMSTHDQKKSHMSAISQLSTQILQRARRVEVVEMRVLSPIARVDFSTLLILFTLLLHLLAFLYADYSHQSRYSDLSRRKSIGQL